MMMDDYYVVTVDPTSEPVTLTEAKSWLRVSTSDDDTLINNLITAARQFGEKYCNRIFTERTILGQFAGIDRSNYETYQFIQIRRAPLIALSSLEIYTGGAYTASTDYLTKNTNGFTRILFPNGIDADETVIYPIQITGTFGYTTVPEDLKQALLNHIAFWYENRGDTVSEGNLSMPLETKSIYSGKYRIINTY